MNDKEQSETILRLHKLLFKVKEEIAINRQAIEEQQEKTTDERLNYYFKLISLRNHLKKLLGITDLERNGVRSIP